MIKKRNYYNGREEEKVPQSNTGDGVFDFEESRKRFKKNEPIPLNQERVKFVNLDSAQNLSLQSLIDNLVDLVWRIQGHCEKAISQENLDAQQDSTEVSLAMKELGLAFSKLKEQVSIDQSEQICEKLLFLVEFATNFQLIAYEEQKILSNVLDYLVVAKRHLISICVQGIITNKFIILRSPTMLLRVTELFNDCLACSTKDHEKRCVALDLLSAFNSQLNLTDMSLILQFMKDSLTLNPCESIYQGTRVKAIEVLLSDTMAQSFPAIDSETIMLMIENQRNDQDHIVRAALIKNLRLRIHRLYDRYRVLYDKICEAPSKESNHEVRKEIFKLICEKSNMLYHQAQISKERFDINDVVNEAVTALCTQIRAMDKIMRIYCAELLQELQGIPESSIIQMLQKESFFQQKFVQIGVGQNKGGNQHNKSKGKKGNDPLMLQQPMHQQPLLSNQVTGILLLMLEDDSMGVRIAGIKAMSSFAKQVQSMRKLCLNFLIDMLNDEIDEVRIGALHGISGFNEILALNDEEVDSVLFNLNEDNKRLREEIYKFFGRTIISQTQLLQKLLKKLNDNLLHFQEQDQHFIFELLRQLGLTHSTLVSSLFYKILGIDKRFQGKDPSWSDVVQIGKMILIYAASHHQPEILRDAPSPIIQSLNYLKDEYALYFKPPPENFKRKLSLQFGGPNNQEETDLTALDNQLKQIDILAKKGLLKQILVMTHNSYEQIEKGMPDEVSINIIDQRLSLIYQITLLLLTAFIKKDYIQAINIKMKIQAHYTQRSPKLQDLLNLASIYIYSKLLIQKLELSQQSTVIYSQQFIDLTENLVAFIQSGKLSSSLKVSDFETLLITSILQNQQSLSSRDTRSHFALTLTNSLDHTLPFRQLLHSCFDPHSITAVYTAAFITHPRDNQNEAFSFNSRHSEFIAIKGSQISCENSDAIMVGYPDGSYQQYLKQTNHAIGTQHGMQGARQVERLEQMIEIVEEKGWSRESNIDIFIGAQLQSDAESQVVCGLMGMKVDQLDSQVVRVDGDSKVMLVKSNIKRFLVCPK
ncbi:hypothetical protein FGO68_gene4412 [Halteria grandinella]|uniref:Uncharacterized protein n=1 Tax=Halteria grandinella TaxID=5974 RepID=A0A8J8P4E7_HALGN|nr:hypothetical protein FGO68_gene4412 [Halteria grandinella]